MTFLSQPRQELVQHHHLPRVLGNVSVCRVGRTCSRASRYYHSAVVSVMYVYTWFSSIEEVGMVATLAELHEYVEELHLPTPANPIHHINILHQNLGIPATQ